LEDEPIIIYDIHNEVGMVDQVNLLDVGTFAQGCIFMLPPSHDRKNTTKNIQYFKKQSEQLYRYLFNFYI